MDKKILSISLDQENNIGLSLTETKENNQNIILDQEKWEDGNNTSKELLARIDKFLQKNNLKIQDLNKIETEIDKNQRYTISRIIQITAKTLNYALQTSENE